jgi:hypothetical protein
VDTVDDFEADLVAFLFFSDSSCSQGEGKALLICYQDMFPQIKSASRSDWSPEICSDQRPARSDDSPLKRTLP